jgi:hypothetical protein
MWPELARASCERGPPQLSGGMGSQVANVATTATSGIRTRMQSRRLAACEKSTISMHFLEGFWPRLCRVLSVVWARGRCLAPAEVDTGKGI